MKNYNYIRESSPTHRIKTLIFSIVALAIFLFLAIFFYKFWYGFLQTTPFLYKIITSIRYNITNTTPIGLFYGHLIGGIFFVPSADELIFYYGLMNGNSLL